jgi:hypothetical protein
MPQKDLDSALERISEIVDETGTLPSDYQIRPNPDGDGWDIVQPDPRLPDNQTTKD